MPIIILVLLVVAWGLLWLVLRQETARIDYLRKTKQRLYHLNKDDHSKRVQFDEDDIK